MRIAGWAGLAMLFACSTPSQVPFDVLDPTWTRVDREPRIASDATGSFVRFDERHASGALWNPALQMRDGDLDVDVRGRDVQQKSFVGLAFRVADAGTFEVVWLRPFNFRSPDPVRRGRAVQFASYPDHPWQRLREERPGAFEAALDPSPAPGAWVHLHVELRGRDVRVFIDHAATPALRVQTPDPPRTGGVGLWVGSDSDGDFRDFRVCVIAERVPH